MADDRTPADEETPQEPTAGDEQPVQDPAAEQPAGEEQPAAERPTPAEEPAAPVEEPVAQEPVAEEPVAEEPVAEEPVAEPPAPEPRADETRPAAPVAEETPAAAPVAQETSAAAPVAEETPAAAPVAHETPAAAPVAEPAAEPVAAQPAAEATSDDDEDEEEPTPRVKPEIPGADLEVDIVLEGTERGESLYDEDDDGESSREDSDDVPEDQPIAAVTIDLAAGARYSATGKRKTAVARVILKPGDGSYVINGRTLEEFFPRTPLQRNIRQPLEAVGYESRMDVVARMHGGGVSAQAGALRHGISRALLEADPNLRGELKRRGFLTRDPRVKERKKAGLKKARKRPQFSKR
jgi:small subunit ribosomal protein S9